MCACNLYEPLSGLYPKVELALLLRSDWQCRSDSLNDFDGDGCKDGVEDQDSAFSMPRVDLVSLGHLIVIPNIPRSHRPLEHVFAGCSNTIWN